MKDRLMRAAVRTAMAADPLVRLVGRKRQRGVDAALDPQIAAALELQRIARLPDLDKMKPSAARRYAESGMSPLDLDPAAMAEVIDTTITARDGAALPVRIFVPPDAGRDWIVYFHGGGGVIGSIAGSEPVTRYLAARTRCTVASVAYRLGPEHRHPIAVEDACDAWDALVARAPASARIAVAGDSFGGYLSAQVDHDTRRASKRRPDVQGLIYPMVDLTLTSPSIDRHAHGYLLTRATMHWFRSHYLPPDAGVDVQRAGSPKFWPDDELRGAAPALVITAGFDPLVDEGDAWAARLARLGATVRHRREASLVHGFLSVAGAVRAARAATDRICADLAEMLRS